jgi:uncharacterized phiE125 gp8 family phage protein
VGTLETTIAALDQPVSIDDARMQCRLGDDASFDATLVRYIAAATSEIEQHTGLILAERTMLLRLDGFPAYDIDLQTYPVQSITSIKYDDSGNVETTLAATEYFTQLSGPTPFVRPVSAWPSTYLDKPASVRITMIVGYPEIDQNTRGFEAGCAVSGIRFMGSAR